MKLGTYIMAPEPTSLAYSQIHPIGNTNTAASQIVNNLNITSLPEPIIMKCGMYIMLPKTISMMYFTNPAHQ
jgi:hypothetical protein